MNLKTKLLPVLKSKWTMSIAAAFAFVIVAGFVAFEATKAEVQFTHNEETETVVTHANTVEELLTELDIEISEHDELSHTLEDEIESEMEIVYQEAKSVTLVVDDEQSSHYTTEDTVEDFLNEIALEVEDHDEVNVDLDESIEEDLEITIDYAIEITVEDAGEEENYWTTEETVEDLLETEEIELDELDEVEPGLDESLDQDLTISITRVEEESEVVEESIDFSTVRRNDDSLEEGTEEVVESGSEGTVEKEYLIRIENGEEVDRELVSEDVKEEAEERVIAVGTQPVQETVSRGGSSSNDEAPSSGNTMTMEATAYNWNCATCDGRGRTATGYNLKENPDGVVAVDPSVIPLGTRVYVEGYGYAVARDTGGAIQGNKIDLHMRSNAEANRFGRQTVEVQIVD
ncbi:Uncharacterized conserved protein YabE, contains G5 and tandem DUF348 domains [Pelagirhabdus alkalitolerans]|uniref:Uncharacterized conserved protein YabE, contains G5 and tandem DUF348 domains n=1 Tax=Pelagirhabdus alkalitolerans TaxID=1612202 RepID=A0A1G6MLS9_9BACI|nr:ubiquitin-like domain-containing protein [Pelagirhabdus alkalitolerans]SDC55895.1 Uncharacterized conserved protein YabE, contains G5 and tandem DUF348 domains [Pelagirhabdus alkalitolerans]